MPTVRLPLSWPFNPRRPDTDKDQKRINVMDEVLGERVYTLKRPGTATYLTYTAGEGQGLTYFNGGVYSVIGDTLNASFVAASGTSGASWVNAGNATWAPRSNMKVVDLNGSIFMIGGFDAALNIRYSDVWQLKSGGGWLQCTAAAPWTVRSSFMTGVIGDTMFVFGGITGASTENNDVWSSTDGVTWTQVTAAAAWTARDSAGTISADNGIYLLGGFNGSAALNDVWFTTDGITWKQVSPAAIQADGSAAWAIRHSMATYYFNPGNSGVPADKNKLWVAGGISGSTERNDVWYSADAGRTWTRSASSAFSSTGRYSAGFTVYDNKMWLINGLTDAAVISNIVYSSPDGVTWTASTATAPMTANYGGVVYVAPVPVGVSVYGYTTMWYVGGNVFAGPISTQYYGLLDNSLALATALTTAVADEPYQFAPFNNNDQLLTKNQLDLWVIANGHVVKVEDVRYPDITVPGLVVLGGYVYVMDPTGLIRNCALSDPFSWPLLNAVGADYESDLGVALCKYLNYVVAFGTFTMQFFYDAGITNGSPLRPYLNANLKIGCAAAATVVNVGPTVVWVSQTEQFNRQVMMLNGLVPTVISTPAVDKLLSYVNMASANLRAVAAYSEGHLFYILSNASGSSTASSLVYDFSTKQWFEWRDFQDFGPFDYAASCTNFNTLGNLMLHPFNGTIYVFNSLYNDDDGLPFSVVLQTGRFDFENSYNKFWGRTLIIGDRNTGTPLIQSSDDDYQNFDAGRTQDMSVDWNAPMVALFGEGAGTRRAWRVIQTDSNPMRLEALEVNYEQGGDIVTQENQ